MRVLVTRPEADARRTAQCLEALGHDCLVVPLTATRMLPFAWPDETIDALIVTSANAVAALSASAVRPDVPVFAVGDRTAAAVGERGVTDVHGGGGDATALLATIGAALKTPARLLYLAGVDRKPGLEAGLAARGYAVVVREVYKVAPINGLPPVLADALRRGRIDAALHYSRRSAAIFRRLTTEAGFGSVIAALRHHCLSHDAAEPLRAAGARRITVAEHPTEAALLATCR